MENAIATVCLSGGLSEKLLAITAAGFKNLEVDILYEYDHPGGANHNGHH